MEPVTAEENAHITAVRESWRSLEQVPVAERTREVLVAAVQENWGALQFLEGGCDDKELLLEALSQESLALQFASERLRADADVVLRAVQGNGLMLEEAHACVREQRDVVMAAVRQNGLALELASEALRADADIVAAALETEPLAFQYADASLYDNRGLVLAAIEKEWRVLEVLADVEHPFLSDPEVALAAVRKSGEALQLIHPSCHNALLVLEAARASKAGSNDLQVVDEAIFEDRELVLQLMATDGLLLRFVPGRFRMDPAVCLLALTQTRRAKKYVSSELWNDPEFAERASRVIAVASAEARGRKTPTRAVRRMTAPYLEDSSELAAEPQ